MDVLAALFHPLEPRLLMLCSDTSRTDSLERYLRHLPLPVEGLQPDVQPAFDYETSRHKAILVEPGRGERQKGVRWVDDIRRSNSWASVLVALTGADPAIRQAYQHAGADHVLRLPGPEQEREAFYLALFQNPDYWNLAPPVLDPVRLCLEDATRRLDLTFVQVQVVLALLYAPHHQLSFDDLAQLLGLNMRTYDVRVVEKFVSRLRSSIRRAFGTHVIQSVRGTGYRLIRGCISPPPIAFR